MRTLSSDEFFALAEVKPTTFRAAISRREAVFMAGLDRMLAGGTFLDLDAVAWKLTDELAPALTRKVAAVLLKGFNDQWCAAVSKADQIAEPTFLVALERGQVLEEVELYGQSRKGLGLREAVNISYGTMRELGEFDHNKATTIPDRMTLINVTSLLARVRDRAKVIGIDLSAPFLPPLGDPSFEQMLAEVKTFRENLVTRVRFPRQAERPE
ncbi:hypothetical protein [Mesorhizobium amorphae]|uniref:hypothetical protein n=1 Tax=Mesorhizobium amorphae TaxID=71433 RepID=UPI00177C3F80|nr:hypothetical protein [Mesorhizobium amorphae]